MSLDKSIEKLVETLRKLEDLGNNVADWSEVVDRTVEAIREAKKLSRFGDKVVKVLSALSELREIKEGIKDRLNILQEILHSTDEAETEALQWLVEEVRKKT